MASIVDYVRACNDSFADVPLGQVDSLVFSWLAYAHIPEEVAAAATDEGIALAQVGALPASEILGLVAPMYDYRSSEELLKACAASPRFGQVAAARCVDTWSREGEVQFSATTFVLPDGQGAYVAFRGTDDTLVGWKENFNMAFQTIPAQTNARDYLEQVAAGVQGPLWVGGHSKGGNLAVYALNTCTQQVRDRVKRCFAHDAPGFTDQVRSECSWAGADDAVDKTIPEESLVGLLFEDNAQGVTVVKSTNPGILQHSPFSWVVEGADFATASAVSYDSYRKNKRLNAWLGTFDAQQRERLVGVLYKLANATGEVTLSGITGTLSDGSLDLALRRLDGLPEADRAFFTEAVEDLVATMLLGPAPANPQTPTERANAAADKIDDLSARMDDRLSKLDKYLGL